jgi:hypothetical protein
MDRATRKRFGSMHHNCVVPFVVQLDLAFNPFSGLLGNFRKNWTPT